MNCPMCGDPWDDDVCTTCGWSEDAHARRAAVRALIRPDDPPARDHDDDEDPDYSGGGR